jgi:hypothetical protein
MMINMNDYVKVKLTELGRQELKKQHDEMNERLISRGGMPYDTFQIVRDDEGYTMFQLWKLMSHFGHMMYNGSKMPFEMDIKLD